MAVWKRKALATLPELAKEIHKADYTPYQLFFDLVPLVLEAHRKHENDFPRRAYGFAEWCLSQESKDLWNSAGVAFYEDLIKERELWRAIIPWLSKNVLAQVQGLWELALNRHDYQELVRLVEAHIRSKAKTCD